MSCNPYAIFGFGDPSLPPCDDLSRGLVVGDAPGPPAFNPYPDDPFFAGLRPADYARAASTLRADFNLRTQLNRPYEVGFEQYLARRLDRLEAGFPMSVPFDASVGRAGGNVFDQNLLAQQLIASGQLRLGPEAFQTPDARAALAMALSTIPTASPVGGAMSSSWFGLGGIAPGGTTPFLPFGTPFQAGGGDPFGLPPSDAAGGGSIFGGLISALPGLLTGLAQAGVIRGSVGQALAPQPMFLPAMAAAPATTTQAVLQSLLSGVSNLTPTQVMAGGSLAIDAMQMLSGLFGGNGSGSCGARPPVQAPTLFRMGCGGRMSLPARQQVIGPDGSLYIVASLGKATRGSREEATMRRLARQNGFTVTRKGTARGRVRRRPR